jgi:hypothetical protein
MSAEIFACVCRCTSDDTFTRYLKYGVMAFVICEAVIHLVALICLLCYIAGTESYESDMGAMGAMANKTEDEFSTDLDTDSYADSNIDSDTDPDTKSSTGSATNSNTDSAYLAHSCVTDNRSGQDADLKSHEDDGKTRDHPVTDYA